MPEMDARTRAEFLLRDHLPQNNYLYDYYRVLDKVAEVIEEAEGYAQSKGREEMIDSAEENTLLRLHITNMLPVVEAAKDCVAARLEAERVFAAEMDTGNPDFLKLSREEAIEANCAANNALQEAVVVYAAFVQKAGV